MMLRNLLDEMMRRRLLPVAAAAVLVAIIAPLLFLKGAPDGAPSADAAAPATATAAKLPPRAARLLAATDAGASGSGAKGASHDPFLPPASYRAALAAGASGAAASASGATKSSSASAKATGSGGGSSSTTVPAVDKQPSAKSNGSTSQKSSRPAPRTIAVDVRYGKKADTKIRRAIPRNQAFYIHGKLVAIFVKYSPARDKAVFAVAPGMHISGPVKCRVQDGACRYLDIPAGSHAWITTIIDNHLVVARRLDVVHTRSITAGTTKAVSASARKNAACLLGKLVAMDRGDALLDRTACER